MAKISALPTVAKPTGDETVVVVDGGVAKRLKVGLLASAAVAPAVASAASSASSALQSYDPEAHALTAILPAGATVHIDARGGLSLSRSRRRKRTS